MNPFDIESILLGEILQFGEQAAKAVMPELTHSKFIYGTNGELGGTGHSQIYQAMMLAHSRDKLPPSIPNILPLLEHRSDMQAYLQSLVGRLRDQYNVVEFDPRGIRGRATTVDKQAVVYHLAAKASKYGDVVRDDKAFADYVDKIKNVDSWANGVLAEFRIDLRNGSDGYTHLSVVAEDVLKQWHGIRKGEIGLLLPMGLPSFASRALMPARKLIVVHGMSSGGKSVLVHLMNLGTAIGLYKNGIPGCVAVNSLEESRGEVLEKWAFTLAGVDNLKLYQGKDAITDEEWKRLEGWLEFCTKLPIYIDGTNALTSSVLDYRLNGLHDSDKGPVWQMSADYIELFGTEDLASDNREQELAAVIDKHFQISRQLGTCVIVISQSTFGQGGRSKSWIAGPMGTRNSRAVQHRADIILEVWNPIELEKAGVDFTAPEYMNEHQAWVLVQKYRRGPKGDPIPLTWKPEYTQMIDPLLNQGLGKTTLFSHLDEVKKMMAVNKTIPAVTDTDLPKVVEGTAQALSTF